MKHIKIITPLLSRVIIFLCLFVVLSGLIGPRIISSDVLLRDGFVIYGTLGKAFIFGGIALGLLAWHKKARLKLEPWDTTLIGWLAAGVLAGSIAWLLIDKLIGGQFEPHHVIAAHASLVLSVLCIALGCFGIGNIRLIWQFYRREIIISVLLTMGFYLFLLAVFALWQPLAAIVLYAVNGLLTMSGLTALVAPPHSLVFDKFGITVAEHCSGIESIALFTSLYAIVGLLDWPRLNKKRYFVIFPFALAVLFGLNILRVYGLIMAGYYINPAIAFSLFHTYAGLVFFILYSALFWTIAYRHLLKPKEAS